MPRAIGELRGDRASDVEAAVGSRSFKRGRGYARGKKVATYEWDPSGEALTGSVVGQGALYQTAAYFTADRDGRWPSTTASAPARWDTTASTWRRS